MNVLLFNTAIGTSNNGDYIIYESAKNELQFLLYDSYTMELSSHLENLGLLHYLFPSAKYMFSKECDYKLILGTNLLTSNMLKSIRQWPVAFLNRKVYYNSIMMGVGTTNDNINLDAITKNMYTRILRKDCIHSVRDEKSRELLSSIKGINVLNTGCPTLWQLTPEVCSLIPCRKARNVIVSVSGYSNQIDRVSDQKLVDIVEKNYDEIFFWVQTIEDEKYFKTLIHRKEYKRIYSLEMFKQICKDADVDYVGTRLHGGIFAMQNRIRTIIVEIDHRAMGFRKDNNIVTVPRNDIESLDYKINENFETKIRINSKAIEEWKYQFKYLEP